MQSRVRESLPSLNLWCNLDVIGASSSSWLCSSDGLCALCSVQELFTYRCVIMHLHLHGHVHPMVHARYVVSRNCLHIYQVIVSSMDRKVREVGSSVKYQDMPTTLHQISVFKQIVGNFKLWWNCVRSDQCWQQGHRWPPRGIPPC